jgi:homospermidine synthase
MSRPTRILFLGCGSVTQAVLPLLLRDVKVPASSITILDFVDNRHRIANELQSGVTYKELKITPENLSDVLAAHVGSGDMLIDLAWNIDAPTILTWCHNNNVRYLNTSVEVWNPYEDMASTHPLDRTLYVRHQELARMIREWGGNSGPTAVLEHGANPGMVSHFVKLALRELSQKILSDGIAGDRKSGLEDALANDQFNMLAMLTGTKVIHISERDTQISTQPKEPNEFVNTWSVEGFYEEGIAPAELGWGTHERTLPKNGYAHTTDGPRNQICIAQPGMETWVRSTVPSGEIHGMVIRHGEAYTMCEHLSVYDDKGNAIYRPTVHYAYCPTDAAIASVHELRWHNWEMQPKQRIMNNEIHSGRDELGVLLMGHDYKSWWTGSQLSIDEARAILPGQSATTLQVASSVMSAIVWMFDEPERGVCVPDDLPWETLLATARPYLGTMFSGPIDWDPLSTRVPVFPGFSDEGARLDPSDPWQFCNFLV